MLGPFGDVLLHVVVQRNLPALSQEQDAHGGELFGYRSRGKDGCGCDGIPHSRTAMPYPPSYTTVPFWLTAKLQPGELEVFHSANNASILALNFECEALSKRELR